MSRGKDTGRGADYDPRTSIYTPEGRLYLVELALDKAVSSAGAASLGAEDWLFAVTDKKVQDKLQDQRNQNTKIVPPSPPPVNNSEILEDQNVIPRHDGA